MTDEASGGSPPVLAVAELRDRLSSASGLLLGLDFDGTLTPVVDDPDAPVVSDSNRAALGRLARSADVRVAVLSGRALSDLRGRVGVDGVTYAGNHGLEYWRDGEAVVASEVEGHRSGIRELVGVLGDRLGGVDGCVVEDKGVTATVHYRQVASDRVGEVRSQVREVVAERGFEGVEVRSGKQVLELRPAVSVDKGTVVRELVEAVGDDWVTVYVGDDTTDEDAFRVLREMEDGLGVRVGAGSETAAERRVGGPGEVEELLGWVVESGVAELG